MSGLVTYQPGIFNTTDKNLSSAKPDFKVKKQLLKFHFLILFVGLGAKQ